MGFLLILLAFINTSDPALRSTVLEASVHDYLLTGGEDSLLNTDEPLLTLTPNEQQMIPLNPRNLHFHTTPSIILPRVVKSNNTRNNNGVNGGDRQDTGLVGASTDNEWSRRQFSVLWSPLPRDNTGGISTNSIDQQNGLNHRLVTYSMNSIAESEVEKGSLFFKGLLFTHHTHHRGK